MTIRQPTANQKTSIGTAIESLSRFGKAIESDPTLQNRISTKLLDELALDPIANLERIRTAFDIMDESIKTTNERRPRSNGKAPIPTRPFRPASNDRHSESSNTGRKGPSMQTTAISREQKIAAMQLALAFAVGDAKEIRYGIVQEAIVNPDENPTSTQARFYAAVKTLFPEAKTLDEASTHDIREIFAAALRAFEKKNSLETLIDCEPSSTSIPTKRTQ